MLRLRLLRLLKPILHDPRDCSHAPDIGAQWASAERRYRVHGPKSRGFNFGLEQQFNTALKMGKIRFNRTLEYRAIE